MSTCLQRNCKSTEKLKDRLDLGKIRKKKKKKRERGRREKSLVKCRSNCMLMVDFSGRWERILFGKNTVLWVFAKLILFQD